METRNVGCKRGSGVFVENKSGNGDGPEEQGSKRRTIRNDEWRHASFELVRDEPLSESKAAAKSLPLARENVCRVDEVALATFSSGEDSEGEAAMWASARRRWMARLAPNHRNLTAPLQSDATNSKIRALSKDQTSQGKKRAGRKKPVLVVCKRALPPLCPPPSSGFPPSVVLVLGSGPSVASLQQSEYYAYPQNHFWPVWGLLTGAAIDPSPPPAHDTPSPNTHAPSTPAHKTCPPPLADKSTIISSSTVTEGTCASEGKHPESDDKNTRSSSGSMPDNLEYSRSSDGARPDRARPTALRLNARHIQQAVDWFHRTDYDSRCGVLWRAGVCVWDVLASFRRRGSQDATFSDERVNDFQSFFRRHPSLRLVVCNGAKAHSVFTKHVRTTRLRRSKHFEDPLTGHVKKESNGHVDSSNKSKSKNNRCSGNEEARRESVTGLVERVAGREHIQVIRVPSTSPAHAMRHAVARKAQQWYRALCRSVDVDVMGLRRPQVAALLESPTPNERRRGKRGGNTLGTSM